MIVRESPADWKFRISWKVSKWYVMYKTHHTFKLEVYGKLFHFDHFELKSRLYELHFFHIFLY